MQPTDPTFTEAIGPYLPLIGLVISGIILGAFGVWNRRRGNQETKAPDVDQMWKQQESDRRAKYTLEDMWWTLRRAFQSYYRRVQAGGSRELTADEQAAIDRKLPE